MYVLMMLMLCYIPYMFPYNINVGSTGLLFPYTLGALAYIKTCVKPSDYRLLGVSGGTWCSLIYHFEKNISDHDLLWSILVGNKTQTVHLLNRDSMSKFQLKVAENFKTRYKDANVSDIPISIITTQIRGYTPKSCLISSFDNIDDLVNYCLCSSYIPCISGKGVNMVYKKKKYIDGEIFKNKNLLLENAALHLHKATWKRKFKLRDYLYLDFNCSKTLFEYGWKDAQKHL